MCSSDWTSIAKKSENFHRCLCLFDRSQSLETPHSGSDQTKTTPQLHIEIILNIYLHYQGQIESHASGRKFSFKPLTWKLERKLKAGTPVSTCCCFLEGKERFISPIKTICHSADTPLQSSDRESYFSGGQWQVAPSLSEVFHYLFKVAYGEQWKQWRDYLSLRQADE